MGKLDQYYNAAKVVGSREDVRWERKRHSMGNMTNMDKIK